MTNDDAEHEKIPAGILGNAPPPPTSPCPGCGTLVVYDAERSGYCGSSCHHETRTPWDADPDYYRNLPERE